MVIGHEGKSEGAGDRLTLKEAALLAGVTEKSIRHQLAGRVARAHRVGGRLTFSGREVLFFRLLAELPFDLKKTDREDLFEVVALEKSEKGHWKRDAQGLVLTGGVPTELRTAPLVRDVARALKRYLNGRRRVVSRPDILGGEPVFVGTRISVRHVGTLVKKGVPRSQLAEDFPVLGEADLEFARIFLDLGRAPGRPRKLKFIRGDG